MLIESVVFLVVANEVDPKLFDAAMCDLETIRGIFLLFIFILLTNFTYLNLAPTVFVKNSSCNLLNTDRPDET